MKRWFNEIGKKIQRWCEGAYGYDELGMFLILSSLIILLFGYIPGMRFLSVLSMVPLFWALFRCFSRNKYMRYSELEEYIKIKKKINEKLKLYQNKWRDRKTHCYVKCKHCGAILRVPKGKGNIEITCPRCGNKTSKKT